jgi:hypothetical protein
MAKRGVFRRRPGEQPDLPDVLTRPYRAPLAAARLASIDVAAIRNKLGLSQTRFAHRFGFPVATLRHVIDYNAAVATRAILRAKRSQRERPVV